ncbi:hypothetical protein [Marinicella sediminis]|nr:hypothetical protein [Marinicella sediminis]
MKKKKREKKLRFLIYEIWNGFWVAGVATLVFSIYLSYFTSINIAKLFTLELYLLLLCLYLVGYQLILEYLKSSKPTQIILAFMILVIHFLAFSFMSNLVKTELFYSVGPLYEPSLELVNSLVLIKYVTINLLLISVAGVAVTIKHYTKNLKDSVKTFSLYHLIFIGLAGGVIMKYSLELYKFERDAYLGRNQFISNFDFRNQYVCLSKIKLKINPVNEDSFYFNQLTTNGSNKVGFHEYSCSQFIAATNDFRNLAENLLRWKKE